MEEEGRGTTSNSIQTHHFEGCLRVAKSFSEFSFSYSVTPLFQKKSLIAIRMSRRP